MRFPGARIGDIHVCPAAPPGAPIAMGQMNVLVGKRPASRLSDALVCGVPDVIAKGSTGVFIGKLPAARIADVTAVGGVITTGEFTVLIGEAGAGAMGAAAGGAASKAPCMKAAAAAGAPFVRV